MYFPKIREILGVSLGLLERYGICMILYLFLSGSQIPDETPSIFRNSGHLLFEARAAKLETNKFNIYLDCLNIIKQKF